MCSQRFIIIVAAAAAVDAVLEHVCQAANHFDSVQRAVETNPVAKSSKSRGGASACFARKEQSSEGDDPSLPSQGNTPMFWQS